MLKIESDMSAKIITKAVEDFLHEAAPGVLSIKGGWGLGKTYFWNEIRVRRFGVNIN